MNKILKKLHSPWLEAMLAFISSVIGLFIGKFIEAIFPPLFQLSNLPYIAFILIAILFLANAIYSITLWRSTREYVVEIAKSTDEITIAIGQSVKTVTYDDGYKELEKRILSAQKEILILTDYIFDWERGKPIWDPERTNSPQRKSFYALLQKTLKRQKNNRDFRFVKIVQIPVQHSINEVFKFDPLYAEDCQSIIDIAKNETEFACLKVAPKIFSNSIIIIDKEFAHISFDIHSPKENEVDAPFVMLIQDPTSVSLVNLHKLYKRIEAHSSLVTKLVY